MAETRNTLEYYEKNADRFLAETQSVDFSEIRNLFLERLPKDARILDFGCGSGRDALAFLKRGYQVEAADGSARMCRAAQVLTGIPVRRMLFQELDETEKYDGIWACSSILHLPKAELREVLERMAKALKEGGVIYTSFKYGTYEGERNGRYFTDFTEASFLGYLGGKSQLRIERMWKTSDVRPGRGEGKWLNVLLQKQQRERG